MRTCQMGLEDIVYADSDVLIPSLLDTCRHGISRIFCSADDLIDAYSNGCPGPEDQEQCSVCERSKPANMWVVRCELDDIFKLLHSRNN